MTPLPYLTVHEPGWLTTVQDEGRWGWQHLGVPVGGPMDLHAFRRANRLVGNAPHAAALEVTLAGPTLDVVGDVTLALAGATFEGRVDGRPLPPETAVRVAGHARLEIGPRRQGARGYLAVSGGLDTPLVLGSRATALGMPGMRGLQRGDVLPVGRLQTPPPERPPAPRVGSDHPLRLLPGDAADDDEARRALEVLCVGVYEVEAQSNRMGYRLRGPRLALSGDRRFSSGTVAGMLQVPPDGHPILLMADRQTTGGYPVVGVVISADLPRAGQLAPGDACRFSVCTRQEAMAALLAQEQAALGG